MRMTAIHAQTERKRQDRSVRCAEKHRRRARTRRLRGLIRPVPAACATEDTGWGEKCLSSGQKISRSSRQPACHLGNVGQNRWRQNSLQAVHRAVQPQDAQHPTVRVQPDWADEVSLDVLAIQFSGLARRALARRAKA
jgi:hypothetical protein